MKYETIHSLMRSDPFSHESEVRSYCRHFPAVFARGRNAEVWDEEGNRYIDLLAACGSLNYGHNNPRLVERLVAYIQANGIASAMDLRTSAKRAFLHELVETILAPRGLRYRVQFPGPTGTNAVEAALKLARKVTRRQSVVAFSNAFHGMTLGALATTGNADARNGAGVPLPHVIRLPFDGYAGPGIQHLKAFEALVNDPSGGMEAPAAFIVETVQGEGGLSVGSVGWLRELSTCAARMGALLIVDDVQAGCGRTGTFFSFERAGLQPDLICLAKSIGGSGLPFSLVLIRPELDCWSPGEHNGTFRGNNLAFVTATAALEYWRDEAFQAAITHKASIVSAWVARMCALYQGAIAARGMGLFQGLAFAEADLGRRVSAAAFKRGVIAETCGAHGEVIKIMPPLTIEENVLGEALGRLEEAVAAELGNVLSTCERIAA